MSAQVTEAHVLATRAIQVAFSRLPYAEAMEKVAQVIADSEAKATAQLRAEIARLDTEKPWLKEANATVADLRAEVEHYKFLHQCESDSSVEAYARAERAEAELHALRLICGATDADPMPAEHYVAETLGKLRAELEQSQSVVLFTRQHSILAMTRIRALVGATDADPLSAEHYVGEALGKLRAELATCKDASEALVESLRAEVERLKADGAASAFVNMSCRASRAETDRKTVLRVSEIELSRREMDPYYRGNVVSALGDLLAEKAGMGIEIGLTSTGFVEELERIRVFLGAEYYTGTIDNETMERIYSFYPPKIAAMKEEA